MEMADERGRGLRNAVCFRNGVFEEIPNRMNGGDIRDGIFFDLQIFVKRKGRNAQSVPPPHARLLIRMNERHGKTCEKDPAMFEKIDLVLRPGHKIGNELRLI